MAKEAIMRVLVATELFGFTVIDRDGGEMFTSDPEYPSYKKQNVLEIICCAI